MYRLLNVNDGHEYAALVHDAYQADGELGIDFAAVTLPEEKLIRGLILNPTYGLFIEGRLVSAIKAYRDRTGVDLKTAKATIDAAR